MATNPVERNFVTRYILGFAVIVAMMIGGGAVGSLLGSTSIPYGDFVGVASGAVIVFVGFVIVYRQYDRSYTEES